MKKLLASAVIMGCAFAPTYALSFDLHPNKVKKKFSYSEYKSDQGDKAEKTKPGEKVAKVPEINAAGTAIALALLSGLVLVARERRRTS